MNLKYSKECRYLVVYLVSAHRFRCSWHKANCAFYRAFNAIFWPARPFCYFTLVRCKCIPVILYGLDACPINAIDLKSLQHPITNIFMKMFAEVVTEF